MLNINKDRNEIQRLVLLATMAGKIMIQNGAETYRVEDTIERICKSQNIKYADAFVLPTGIFVSLGYGDDMFTYFSRVSSTGINLDKINLVNDFAREFTNGNISVNDGIKRLKQINKIPNYNLITKSFAIAISSSCFSYLLGGSFKDIIVSFIISLITVTTLKKIEKYKLTFFLNNFLGSMLITVLALIILQFNPTQNMDKVIIGSIMFMVPGVAITNAMRDTMSGDFTSGLSRALEAGFSALAIAFGVGVILNMYY